LKRHLAVAALALLAASCAAQPPQQPSPPAAVDHTMDALLAARAKLIQRYVLPGKVARGVAVCGETDLLTGEDHSYLCVYVWRDSVPAFLRDFLAFATPMSAGDLGVDGVPVVVFLIGDAPKTEKEPNAPKQPARPLPARQA
jgi:hypothetical protein